MDHFAEGAVMAEGDRAQLVVFFSSRLAPQRDQFDFLDGTRDMPQQRLYLRTPPSELFFHDGIPGLTTDMDENADFLRYVINRVAPQRVTFVGHSSGGYAAIVLGHMLGVDDIHAVTPVTYLRPDLGDDPHGGELWDGVYDAIGQHIADTGADRRYLNCRSVIAAHPGKVRVLRQYVIASSPVDLNHAAHIAEFGHVQTVVRPRGRHTTIAARLFRDGTLLSGITSDLNALANQALPPFDRKDYPAAAPENFRAARV